MILPDTKIEDFLDDVGRNSAGPKIEADDASITVLTLSCDHQAKRTVLGDVLADVIVDAAVLAKLDYKRRCQSVLGRLDLFPLASAHTADHHFRHSAQRSFCQCIVGSDSTCGRTMRRPGLFEPITTD